MAHNQAPVSRRVKKDQDNPIFSIADAFASVILNPLQSSVLGAFMNNEIRDAHAVSDSDECGDQSGDLGCRAHWKLNAWQVVQYQRAIDENKWYMTERLGRYVAWEEAEYDFLHHGYYGCAPKWRKEYCARICPHFDNCKLGQHFSKE